MRKLVLRLLCALLVVVPAGSVAQYNDTTFVLKVMHYEIHLPACKKKEQVDKILKDLEKGNRHKAFARYTYYVRQGQCVPTWMVDVYIFEQRYGIIETPEGGLLTPVKVSGLMSGPRYSWTRGCVVTIEELERQKIHVCGKQQKARLNDAGPSPFTSLNTQFASDRQTRFSLFGISQQC